MFKRHASSNKKLISKSAYAIALAVPFISLFGETKASKIISGLKINYFLKINRLKVFNLLINQKNNKFNLNLDDFLIAEGKIKKMKIL